jgi:hypothetical protein
MGWERQGTKSGCMNLKQPCVHVAIFGRCRRHFIPIIHVIHRRASADGVLVRLGFGDSLYVSRGRDGTEKSETYQPLDRRYRAAGALGNRRRDGRAGLPVLGGRTMATAQAAAMDRSTGRWRKGTALDPLFAKGVRPRRDCRPAGGTGRSGDGASVIQRPRSTGMGLPGPGVDRRPDVRRFTAARPLRTERPADRGMCSHVR